MPSARTGSTLHLPFHRAAEDVHHHGRLRASGELPLPLRMTLGSSAIFGALPLNVCGVPHGGTVCSRSALPAQLAIPLCLYLQHYATTNTRTYAGVMQDGRTRWRRWHSAFRALHTTHPYLSRHAAAAPLFAFAARTPTATRLARATIPPPQPVLPHSPLRPCLTHLPFLRYTTCHDSTALQLLSLATYRLKDGRWYVAVCSGYFPPTTTLPFCLQARGRRERTPPGVLHTRTSIHPSRRAEKMARPLCSRLRHRRFTLTTTLWRPLDADGRVHGGDSRCYRARTVKRDDIPCACAHQANADALCRVLLRLLRYIRCSNTLPVAASAPVPC